MTDTSATDTMVKADEGHAQAASASASFPPTPTEPRQEALTTETSEAAPAAPITMSASSPPLTPQPQPSGETITAPEPQVNLPSQQEYEAPSLPPRPAGDQEQPVSPEVAGLLAMFPDFDPTVLQSVLESVDGNQDRAIDTLLSMSDPSYVQEQPPAPEQRSQADLDEEFARNLFLEDQQREQIQQQYHQQYSQGQGGQWNPQQSAHAQQQQRQPSGNKDTMAEVQEQIKQLAESGKKTFSSLVTKVKAKMQEFDQNRNQGSSSGYQPPPQNRQQFPPASWEGGSVGGTITAAQAQQPSWSREEVQYGSAAIAPQQQYFGQEGVPQEQAQGYDVSAPAVSTQPQPGASPRPPSRGAAPPPAPAANIDASKLGLLPKKPVSLLSGSGGSPSRPANRENEDDDELDYVENPFEEHSGRK